MKAAPAKADMVWPEGKEVRLAPLGRALEARILIR